MLRNYFTDEQIMILQRNPYVEKVSKANVTFTEEFKNMFVNLYQSGTGPTEIIRRLGIDPRILGTDRIESMTRRFRAQSSRPEGFLRKASSSKGRPRKKRIPEFSSDREKAEYYKEYAEKLEQEIELLKKVKALEEE